MDRLMSRPFAEVIGDPISHSKSPLIHRFWLQKLGIEADYHALQIAPTDLGDYIKSRTHDADWRGCNVTLPHKIAIMDHVEDPGGVRGSIGAMNCVLRQDGHLIGTNTDAGGFMAPIMDLPLKGGQAIVIGSGGAAHAILFGLKQAGIGQVTLLARNPMKGAALLARFGLKGDVKPLVSPLPPAALLANCSSLGMMGQPDLLLDLAPLPPSAVVYDIVYAPLETKLLKAARDRALDYVDGLTMLIGQAALAFELFFGQAPPAEVEDELRALLTA
jgi:shikimate dehydrogenase